MPIINELPGVYFKENVSYELAGKGSKIPVFIGVTGNKSIYKFTSYNNENKEQLYGNGTVQLTGQVNGNYSEVVVLTNDADTTNNTFTGKKFYIQTNANPDGETAYPLYTDAGSSATGIYVTVQEGYKVDGTKFLSFKSKEQCLSELNETGEDNWEATGIGIPSDENELATVIKDFYDEARLLQSSDIGVDKIYVVDVGDGSNKEAWLNALQTAKRLNDVTVEVYVGAEKITGEGTDGSNYTLKDFLGTAVDSIADESEDLNLRYGFVCQKGATDDELKNLINELLSLYSATTVHKLSRLGICEDLLFGKTIARICCTPNNTEPGYFQYRSVEPGVFNKRTKEEMLSLQNHGIIFNRDEFINGNSYPKINLCVSASFAAETRPADALFHARFNADDLLREVFEVCYTQVKANESLSNIAYLQTMINTIVSNRVLNEEMIAYDETTEVGTKLNVAESPTDPYCIIVSGQIQPVKCTIAIYVQAEIKI